jgi:hypothetical protein
MCDLTAACGGNVICVPRMHGISQPRGGLGKTGWDTVCGRWLIGILLNGRRSALLGRGVEIGVRRRRRYGVREAWLFGLHA